MADPNTITELEPNALCTREEARLWISRTTSQTANDPLLPILINGVSDAIAAYTGRQFLPAENDVEKRFRYDGGGFLELAPYDARAVTAVTLYTDLPQAAWRPLNVQTSTQEAEFRAEPREKTREGTYTWLALPELGKFARYGSVDDLGARQARGYQVTVRGDWAIGSVPGRVRLAALITVSHWFRNPEAFASRDFANDTLLDQVPDEDEWLPPAARGFLQRVRRKAMG